MDIFKELDTTDIIALYAAIISTRKPEAVHLWPRGRTPHNSKTILTTHNHRCSNLKVARPIFLPRIIQVIFGIYNSRIMINSPIMVLFVSKQAINKESIFNPMNRY